jgi:hypothetical protein
MGSTMVENEELTEFQRSDFLSSKEKPLLDELVPHVREQLSVGNQIHDSITPRPTERRSGGHHSKPTVSLHHCITKNMLVSFEH